MRTCCRLSRVLVDWWRAGVRGPSGRRTDGAPFCVVRERTTHAVARGDSPGGDRSEDDCRAVAVYVRRCPVTFVMHSAIEAGPGDPDSHGKCIVGKCRGLGIVAG